MDILKKRIDWEQSAIELQTLAHTLTQIHRKSVRINELDKCIRIYRKYCANCQSQEFLAVQRTPISIESQLNPIVAPFIVNYFETIRRHVPNTTLRLLRPITQR